VLPVAFCVPGGFFPNHAFMGELGLKIPDRGLGFLQLVLELLTRCGLLFEGLLCLLESVHAAANIMLMVDDGHRYLAIAHKATRMSVSTHRMRALG